MRSIAGPVLIVIPVYNSEQHLRELIDRIEKLPEQFNTLFVNDGSTDKSLSILKDSCVNYISFDSNRGKGAALKAGFEYAKKHQFESVITLDSDLQHRPEEIARFSEGVGGLGMVIGRRSINPQVMPWPRCLSNSLTSAIVSIFTGQRISDSQSGFRLIKVSALDRVSFETTSYDFETELILKLSLAGGRIGEVPISTVYDGESSSIRPLADTSRFIRQIWRCIWF